MQVWANVQASRRRDEYANARDWSNEWTSKPTNQLTNVWEERRIGIRSTGFCSVRVCRTPSAHTSQSHRYAIASIKLVWRHFLYMAFYPFENLFDADYTALQQIYFLLNFYWIWEFIEWKTDRCRRCLRRRSSLFIGGDGGAITAIICRCLIWRIDQLRVE